MDVRDLPFADFYARLSRRLERRTKNALPLTRDALVEVRLPAELVALVDEALAQGRSEQVVVRALYDAMLLNRIATRPGSKFAEEVGKAQAKAECDDGLVERFSRELEAWEKAWRLEVATDSVWELPAFLRKAAD